MGEFSGFPDEAIEFLEGLAADNTKAYFDAHRAMYEAALLEPSKAFVADLGAVLQDRVSPEIVADPRVNGSIFRINRDIRFSNDKTPYNTHMRFRFWEGGERTTAPGFWMGFGPESVGFGAGTHGFDKDRLGRYRELVAADTTGVALQLAVDAAVRAGAELSEPKYKTVPKGYDADHPRGGLLRYAGLHVYLEDEVPRVFGDARFVRWCADRLVKVAPVERWFATHSV